MKFCNCPSCGAEIVFHSSLSVYVVCRSCASMVVRHDTDVESIGVMAQLPDDMSPFQIGTDGFRNNLHFTIIGRMKIGWKDGFWNEWHIYADDGRKGWLAEAQGAYMVSFEKDIKDVIKEDVVQGLINTAVVGDDEIEFDSGIDFDFDRGRTPKKIHENKERSHRYQVGSNIFIDTTSYKIVDIKEVVCIGSEGELPLVAPKGRKSISIDLNGEYGEFASIEVSDKNLRLYIGKYFEWDELKCKNFRELEGWKWKT